MSLFAELERREQREQRPVQVAVVGTGYFGAGLVRRLARIKGLTPAIAANRTLERALAAFDSAGIDQARVRVCQDPGDASSALQRGYHVATSMLNLAASVPEVDVVMEATGNVLVGAETALAAIAGRKHIVAANPETHATVGSMLKRLADTAGVVYSDVDGDEPGILTKLFDFCVGLGFEPVLAGNCKGVLKRHATPDTQAGFAEATGIKPWIASAAADGTKLNFELAVVANATGLTPARRGMLGPRTALDTLVADFGRLGLLEGGPFIDYTLGIPGGTFIVFRGDEPEVRSELRYLKMGDGPHYLLHQPHVLIHYQAPLSAAEAALYGTPTVAPLGAPVADVATFAKRDLPAGRRLDGIGGFDCYGLIARADEAARDRLLPVGLAEFARLTRAIGLDQPVSYDDVEIEHDNAVLELRRQQDGLFGPGGTSAIS